MSANAAAERWRQLSETQRREKMRTAIYHLRIYAEAKRDALWAPGATRGRKTGHPTLMGARKSRQRHNKPRGQGIDYRCECGQPSTVLMWLVQLNADDRPHSNFVPLCDACLELERQYNGEPARLTPAPALQVTAERGNMQRLALKWLADNGPATSFQIADALNVTYSSAWNTVQRLLKIAAIHCVAEVRQHNGKITKVWSVNAR